jgi:hypothetical protein
LGAGFLGTGFLGGTGSGPGLGNIGRGRMMVPGLWMMGLTGGFTGVLGTGFGPTGRGMLREPGGVALNYCPSQMISTAVMEQQS